METRQHTIQKKVSFAGIGLHSGKKVKLIVKPAKVNSGIRFFRSDLDCKAGSIPASVNRVTSTMLATTLCAGDAQVSTTEHLLAALNGLGVDNAVVELDNDEVPIMDGSAGPFVRMLRKVGRKPQKAAKRIIKITREISFQSGDKEIRVVPCDEFKLTCEIDFDHELIRRQRYTIKLSPDGFMNEIASARTFGFMKEVEQLRENGLALGGSLDNAIVIDDFGILNAGGLRFSDEFVRHKVLDLIGDLALLGCPLMGHVIASKTGHTQHFELMKAIVAHPECWEYVTFQETEEEGGFERVVMKTRVASNKIIPLLVPPSAPPLAAACSA